MRFLKNTLAILASLFILSSCIKEDFTISGKTGGEGWIELYFGASSSVEVSTKATQGYGAENGISNIYAFIFDSNGNKVYGKWITSNERKQSIAEVNSSSTDAWYVNNGTSSSNPTSGCMKIKASSGTKFKIYLITNLDSDMVRISSDLLSHNISSEDDLLDFRLILNQETVSRNTNFPMVGVLKNVSITENSTSGINSASNPLMLKRLDAKVRFKFKTGNRTDENGQKISKFTAYQWRVVNVPSTSYAIERDVDLTAKNPELTEDDYKKSAPYYFDTNWRNFEEETTTTQEFSFYTMENVLPPKNDTFTSYNDRSRQTKTSSGLNKTVQVDYTTFQGKPKSKDILVFENANDFSTYVLVTGHVDMTLDNDDAGQTLGADVQYMIHLGNWGSNIAPDGQIWKDDKYDNIHDFSTLRNHSYTYTVTVNSVNNIRVEVEDGVTENQPGATGDVVIAKEEIALCDAHYVSKTMTFHAKNIVTKGADGFLTSSADKLTWKVKTPFSEGSPVIKDGVELADHLDYQWVRFRLNKKDEDGAYYKDLRRKYNPEPFKRFELWQTNTELDGTAGLDGYHNDGSMDIIFLVKYIKEQVGLYVDYYNAVEYDKQNGGDGSSIVNKSDFDNGMTSDGTEDPDGSKICITAFVDEFYYSEHPITKQTSPTLWKQFVNKTDRSMHILCDSYASADMESTATGSVITIQQKSIQCIFNDDPDYTSLTTAWGLEHTDEYPDIWEWGSTSSAGNTDPFNGLANSARLWGLCGQNNYTFDNTVKWGKFMDIESPNDVSQLKQNSDYDKLRYSCLARNRDNNGDGIIDRDEIRWYTASIRQLIGMYMAEGVISPSSRLYNRTAEKQASSTPADWMQHVVSSTQGSGSPTIVWAEEGISTGQYSTNQEGAGNNMSVRCIRNLGMSNEHALNEAPQDFITREYSDGHTKFTCTNINEASLRDYTSTEMPLHAQNSQENYLYKKFEVANETVQGSSYTFVQFNNTVTEAIANGQTNPYCPEGYRLPNQREVAIMVYYQLDNGSGVNTDLENGIMSRTAWSFGGTDVGNGKVSTKYGFSYNNGNISLYNKNYAKSSRCVRDIRVE